MTERPIAYARLHLISLESNVLIEKSVYCVSCVVFFQVIVLLGYSSLKLDSLCQREVLAVVDSTCRPPHILLP